MTIESIAPDAKFWMVRAERGGIFADYFVNAGVVTIGWGEVGPILPSDSNEDIIQRCRQKYPGDSNGGHQIRRFVREVEVGDAVVTYLTGARVYQVGIIRSAAEYGPLAHGAESPGYLRRVEWRGEVFRDSLSANARNQLGSLLTVFSLSTATSQELQQYSSVNAETTDDSVKPALLVPESDTEEILDTVEIFSEYIAKSEQFVEDQIAKLDPYEVQDLVAGLLRALGYRTRVSRRGSDRGVDIFASSDGIGLSGPRIFVEVKHRSKSTDAPDIRSFLGGRRTGDRCLYVSTGGFSRDALYEAERSQIPLTLLNMAELRELLTSNYEKLDLETRALVPLRRIFWPAAE